MGLTQVSTNGVKNDAITAGKIPADGVGQSEISDNSIGHGEIKANAVVTEKIASSAITQEKIAEQVINEARLQISNNGTNGQFLSKQSGDTGGLTWATPTDTNTVYTHPNHSGEVTSTADGAQVIADDVVDEANLKISNAGTNGQYLQKQSGNTGGLTWADAGGYGSVLDVWDYASSSGYAASNTAEVLFGQTADPSYSYPSKIFNTASSMTKDDSTGIWTFPSTGKYTIEFITMAQGTGASSWSHQYTMYSKIQTTTNNSSYSVLAGTTTTIMRGYNVQPAEQYYRSKGFFNCTNTSTHKLKITIADAQYKGGFKATSTQPSRLIITKH